MTDPKLLSPSGRSAELPARALIDRREALRVLHPQVVPIELRVVLYAVADQFLILCTTTGIQEAGKPQKLPSDISHEALGTAIRDALLECEAYEPSPMRGPKLSDWAAFVVSQAKTVRAFEEASTYVTVRTVNLGIVIEASRRQPQSETYIVRKLSIASDPATLGAAARSAISALRFLDLHDALT
jgi:hypothetical protein